MEKPLSMGKLGALSMLKTLNIPKTYMAILPILPILAQYSILGGTLDLDVIAMLVVFGGFLLCKKTLRVKNAGIVITLLLYTCLVALGNIMWGRLFAAPSQIIMRMGRYVIYLTLALIVARDTVEYKTIMNACRIVAYVSLVYVAMQAVAFYGAGITLPNKIGAGMGTKVSDVGRLSALFSEPADMCYSLTPFIVCSLFGPQYREKDSRLRDAVCITLAVLLTTSSQGSVCVISLWAVWCVLSAVKGKWNARSIVAFLMAVVVLLILYNSGVLEYSLGRLEDGGESTAWQARSGGYAALQLLSPIQKFLGAGYGNYFSENVYKLDTYGEMVNFSSISESLFTQGIIGSVLMLLLMIRVFAQGKGFQRILVLVMLGLSVGGCPFTGKYLPLYFGLIMCNMDGISKDKKGNELIQQEGAGL